MHEMTLAASGSAGARRAGVHACFPGLACGREIVAIFTIVFLFNSSDTTKEHIK